MRPALIASIVAVFLVGCGADAAPSASPTSGPSTTTGQPGDGGDVGDVVIDPGDGGEYEVEIDPADFSNRVDHQFFPMLPGTSWTYEARTPDGEVEVITVEALDETRVVMGVDTIVVHDIVETSDGEVIEDTYDWYAQDTDGNVWYFGEDTTSYEDGQVSEAGAWEAGVDGALPGIVMPAEPVVTDTGYRQEFLAGEAEDMGQVIDLANGVVVTRDWTPLEPDVVEEKTYLDGVGFVHETKTAGDGSGEQVILVAFDGAP